MEALRESLEVVGPRASPVLDLAGTSGDPLRCGRGTLGIGWRGRCVPWRAQRHATGQQSIIRVNSIIGTRGVPNINPFNLRPGLTNAKLFIRDRNVCAYCGGNFHESELTREHIIPFAQHGIDTWMNVVTACKPCNHRKSHRTPEQAHMPLLYTPYVPSLWEDFILRNRRILADQMEFLMAHVPKSSRLLD